MVALCFVLCLVSPSIGVPAASAAEGESANAAWLRDVYEDILGRDADGGGLDFWVGRLAGGGDRSRAVVARQLVSSPEGSSGEVQRAYGDILGRGPDAAGLPFWTGFLQTEPVVTLRAALYSSDEVLTNAGSVEAWIELLYQDLLGRQPDAAGAAFWKGQIEAGVNRYVLVSQVYLSDEGLGRRVDAYYAEILGRVSTPTERAAGIAIIRGADERELRVVLLSSDERFETFLNRVGV